MSNKENDKIIDNMIDNMENCTDCNSNNVYKYIDTTTLINGIQQGKSIKKPICYNCYSDLVND